MTLFVVVPDDARAARNLESVADSLGEGSAPRLHLGDLRLDRHSKRLGADFRHTPEPLLEAWTTMRKLTAATRPGDTVLASDWRGLGGLFALDQWSRPPEQRRATITVATDSSYLTWSEVAGVVSGFPMPVDSQIDWEIVQYQWSDRVVSPSSSAAEHLQRISVACEVVDSPAEGSRTIGQLVEVWVPEPVGRRSQTGEILRAVAGVPNLRVVVSAVDEDDEVWTGTTWEALRHVRAVLGSRITRSNTAASPSVIILGDPFSVPAPAVANAVANGVPVIVPADSPAAARWPEAPSWADTDDLAALLEGDAPRSRRSAGPSVAATPRRRVADRSRRVSIGIPVFRDVGFLTECVDSVLSQDLQPIEILITDDGSTLPEVDEALAEVRATDDRVRIVRGPNRGVCVARNRALDEMTGDAFLFVDSDDVLEPAFLARCAEMLRSDESLWAVAAWTRFFGAYEGVEAKPPFDARVGLRENPIVSTAALVDMRVRDLGVRFAPDLAFIYCEDWHFWSQIVAAGGNFGLVPEPLVRHRVHRASGGFMRTELAHAIGRTRATEPLRR